MKELITFKKEKKVIEVKKETVNQEALEEIAMELIRGNYDTRTMEISFSYFGEREMEIELVVGDGYSVTIRKGY